MMKVEPQAEHRWLKRLVGEWEGVSDTPDPDGATSPPWTETGRMVGEIWVEVVGEGVMPDGGASQTRMVLGYDPAKGRYLGTWLGSMMTHMWIYEGVREGDVLTLNTEGPDFGSKDGRTARYRDIISLEGDDRRVLRSEMQGEDGSWSQIMQADYRRRR